MLFPLPEHSSLRSLHGLIFGFTQVSAQGHLLRGLFTDHLPKTESLPISLSLTLPYFLHCTYCLRCYITDLIYLLIYHLPH